MPRVRITALLTAALFSLHAAAAPFAVQVGDSRVALDAPAGFSDTSFTGSPRLTELAETLTSPSNRILLFAISDGDLRRFMAGDPPEFRRYMIAVTPKGMERERVNAAAFGTFVADSVKELGRPAPDSNFAKYLDAQPEGKAALLVELRNEPQAVSVLQGTRLPAPQRFNEPPRYLLSTTTLLLVRGKALSLSVFSAYDSTADLEWIRTATLRWIDELQRLNNR